MRALAAFIALAAFACGNQHVDSPTTTSAPVQTARTPVTTPGTPDTTPFDLPKAVLPNATNPRPIADEGVEVRAAQSRDSDITTTIRRAVLDDPNLSAQAKDVEISTSDRKVTLHGRVQTEQERMDIDQKARATANVIEVDDRIELVP